MRKQELLEHLKDEEVKAAIRDIIWQQATYNNLETLTNFAQSLSFK